MRQQDEGTPAPSPQAQRRWDEAGMLRDQWMGELRRHTASISHMRYTSWAGTQKSLRERSCSGGGPVMPRASPGGRVFSKAPRQDTMREALARY
ncbi:hypothetical protein E2C01_054843 [Portunus trituberculatus]|uniref:Uncharacterized protein n=1 Tax=Portunus trituberculatus TaxID=210409 RepID=A0A5B7GUD3_PORTR|nr:hypothetical protein [Portunus trituberculatus]